MLINCNLAPHANIWQLHRPYSSHNAVKKVYSNVEIGVTWVAVFRSVRFVMSPYWQQVAADSRENFTRDNRRHFGCPTNRTLLYYVKIHLPLLLGLCLSSTAEFRTFRRGRKIMKSDYTLVMSVCPSFLPSVRPTLPPASSQWTDFYEFVIWVFFENISRKFKFH